MRFTYWSYAGWGLLFATLYGITNHGMGDYRTQGLFILTTCLLLIDPIKERREKKAKGS